MLVTFTATFFPQVLRTVKTPDPVGFIRFMVIPLLYLIICLHYEQPDVQRHSVIRSVLIKLCTCFTIDNVDTLVGKTKTVGVFLGFVVRTRPFLLLTSVVCVPFSVRGLDHFEG